jgi:hypothetical protein
MFIERIPNRNSPPCILLRETYRHAGKVKHRTIANLSKWPPGVVEGLRRLFKADRHPDSATSSPAFRITRSLPHGHVAAVLSTMRKLGVAHLLGSKPCPERDLCMALIASRILFPGSKLATSRALDPETRLSTLAQECDLPQDWITALRSGQIADLAAEGLIEPSLFDEDDHEAARANRSDAVAPKLPSPSAKRKARSKRTTDGLPVHSFQTLLKDLATITRNTIVPKLPGAPGWQQETEPTPLQEKILQL